MDHITDTSISNLLHFLPTGVIITNLEGGILLVNQQAEKIFGYRMGELINKPIEVLIPPRFKSHVKIRTNFVKNLEANPSRNDLDLFGLRRDGTEFPANISISSLKTENGTLMITSIIDVTERKQMESVLKERNQRYAALFDHSNDAVFIISLEGIHLDANPHAAEMLGYTLEELIGMPIQEIIVPRDLPDAMERYDGLMSGKDMPIYERYFRKKDGSEFPVEINLLLVRDDRGTPQYIQSIVRDISTRKLAEKLLRESESYNRLLFWESPIGLALTTLNGEFVDVNPAFARILGDSVEEVMKCTIEDITPESYTQHDQKQLERLCEIGHYGPYEKEYIHRDGHLVPVSLNGLLLQRGSDTFVWSSVEDITERKKIEDEIRQLNLDLEDRVRQRTLELQESETRFRLFAESAADMFWMMDLQGGITYISPAIERASGYSIEEFKALQFLEIFAPSSVETANNVLHTMLEMAAAGEKFVLPNRLEIEQLRKDGSTYWTDVSPCILYDDDGEPLGLMGVTRDITETHLLQKNLQESETRYRAVVEDQTEYIGRCKPDGTITFGNKQYTDLFQMSAEELVGQNCFNLISERSSERIQRNIQKLSPEQPVIEDEYFSHRSDDQKWYRWFHRGIFDPDGRLLEIQSVGRDITQRKQAEEALRSSETLFRAITEQSGEGISLVNGDGNYVMVNPSFCQVTGYSEAELLEMNVIDLLPSQTELARLEKGLNDQIGFQETFLQKKDGKKIPIDFRGYPISLGSKNLFLGIVRDITDRRNAEMELRLRSASLKAAANAIVITQPDGKITWVNPSFTQLTGYTLDEAVGQYPAILNAGHHDKAFFKNLWDTILSGRVWHGELVNKRKDGSLYNEEMTITPLRVADDKISHFVAIKQDISQRKQTEDALVRKTVELRRSNKLISTLTQMAAKAQAIVDLDKLFKTMERELSELGIHYYVALHDAENQDMVIQYVGFNRKLVELVETILGFDSQGFRFSTKSFPPNTDVLVNAQPKLDCDIEKVLKSVFPKLPDILIKRVIEILGFGPDVVNIYLPLVSEDQVIGVLTVWGGGLREEDIPAFSIFASQVANAIRVAELYRKAQAANQAKTEFLSQMSHELRTPLNSILGFAQLMEISNKEPLSENQRKRVTQIVDGGTHLLNLINEILDLSRIETGRLSISPEPVNVREVIQIASQLARPLADTQGIRMTVGEWDHDVFIQADQQRLKQVCLNLFSNAIKYNRPDGYVEIRGDVQPDGKLRVSVIDSGIGISSEQMKKLFNPFERLGAESSPVEGTGLGLVLSKHLVEMMGGEIGVESRAGKGSTFWIEFPIIKDPLRQDIQTHTGELATLAAEEMKILYIEDNPANYELVKHVLDEYPQIKLYWETQGYSGLDLARHQQFDLILLDLHLPGMSGGEVLKYLKEDRLTETTPVVILSAEAGPERIKELMMMGAEAYLTKPLNVKEFVSLIDQRMITMGA